MTTNTMTSPQTTKNRQETQFPPLEAVTRTHIGTEEAAHYLMRKPQTLRNWAMFENGPLRPLRIHRRLAWSVADIRRILKGNA